jgi:hypothetical protein
MTTALDFDLKRLNYKHGAPNGAYANPSVADIVWGQSVPLLRNRGRRML